MRKKLTEDEREMVQFLEILRAIPHDQRLILGHDFDKTVLPQAVSFIETTLGKIDFTEAARCAVILWIDKLAIDVKKQSRFLDYVFGVNDIERLPASPISDLTVARLARKFESKYRFFDQMMMDLADPRALNGIAFTFDTELRVPISITIDEETVDIKVHDDALKFFLEFRHWTKIHRCRFRNCNEYYLRTRAGQKFCDSNCRNAEAARRRYADPKARAKILKKKRKAYKTKNRGA